MPIDKQYNFVNMQLMFNIFVVVLATVTAFVGHINVISENIINMSLYSMTS